MTTESTFNAEQFLDATTETSGQTKYFPVPVGEYTGQVHNVNAFGGVSERTGTAWRRLEVSWSILDDDVKKATGQDNPIARQGIFLDMTPEGALDWGRNKNIQLGRLREALNQNRDGRPWSPKHLMGQTAHVRVEHEPDQNGDPRAIVRGVTSL